MRYGFIIDQRKCIGCHACTVACKAENLVPLGNFRTWVKYVEKGQYPDTERHFAVLRCNHCDNAPCVKICPVTALYTRQDGIVDFNQERCIGCKSCMQACPYDALYINPVTNTAEKCNYCAHRVEVGLEPACVIVCPEQAIIAGDLDNPRSKISNLLKTERGTVRKPEQGTHPKLYYIDADKSALRPELQHRTTAYLWSELGTKGDLPQGIDLQEFIARQQQSMARTAYDVPHEQPWGWRVSAYLWTKSIAAGAFLLPAIYALFQTEAAPALWWGTTLSLVFQAITSLLLIVDLKRPERFLFILLRPQWRSWLAIGAYILVAFGAVTTLSWLGSLVNATTLTSILLLPGAILAVMAAIYSAFLFAQAEGRDFWQSKLTAPHLLVQAVLAGAASFGLIATLNPLLPLSLLRYTLATGLIAHLLIMIWEVLGHGKAKEQQPQGDDARVAALLMRGPLKTRFWVSAVLLGALLPLTILLAGSPIALSLAALATLVGLLNYESLWIKAGQSMPLS